MSNRNLALNSTQQEILAWIRDGTSEEAYGDYRPRIVARALHNRGLVTIAGHGPSWTATLTEDGAYYLAHGGYPPDPETASHSDPARSTKSPSPARERPAKAARVGPTDAMMNALNAAEDRRIEIGYDEIHRYRQLALSAERFKKIPDGLQVTISSDYQARSAWVTLATRPPGT